MYNVELCACGKGKGETEAGSHHITYLVMLIIKTSIYERGKSRGKIVIVRGNCKKYFNFYRAVEK